MSIAHFTKFQKHKKFFTGLDGSDEQDCPAKNISCDYPSWKCDNGTTCLDVKQICDEKFDCQDRSDEGLRCKDFLCSTPDNHCSDHCQNSPDGHRCHCPSGMHLNETTNGGLYKPNQCIEDHTCKQWGTCSQLCKSGYR